MSAEAEGGRLRFACLSTVAPGRSLAEQCAAIAAAGCSGVESIFFPHDDLERRQQALAHAAGAAGLAPVAVILGGLALYEPGAPDWVEEAVYAVAELGAAVLITPEYRAQDPLPLFPPFPAPGSEEVDAVQANVEALANLTAAAGTTLLLEPITQFESRFWRDTATVLALCQELNRPHVGLALDLHNMNITEADPVASIHRAAGWTRHVHLADNNRRLPGRGHIDFAAHLHALHATGYQGWYSFECAVDGDFTVGLTVAMDHLRSMAPD